MSCLRSGGVWCVGWGLISAVAQGADSRGIDFELSRLGTYVPGQTTLRQFYGDGWNGVDPLRGKLGVLGFRRSPDGTVDMLLGVCPIESNPKMLSVAEDNEAKLRQEPNRDLFNLPCGPTRSQQRNSSEKSLPSVCTEKARLKFKNGSLQSLALIKSDEFSPTAALCYVDQLSNDGEGVDELHRLVAAALENNSPSSISVSAMESRASDTEIFIFRAEGKVRSQPLLERLVERRLLEGSIRVGEMIPRLESERVLARIAMQSPHRYIKPLALKKVTDNAVYADFILRFVEANDHVQAAFWAFDHIEDRNQLARLERELRLKKDPRAALIADQARLRLQFASGRVLNADTTQARLRIANDVRFQAYSPYSPFYTSKITVEVVVPERESFVRIFERGFPGGIYLRDAEALEFWVSPGFSLSAILEEISTWLGASAPVVEK
ncbi:MAG: hypothetical protein KA760_06970 [Steroidobacteraceae bacterium]|nr:hypothetical protein [Steroidobacteraceae bacterium]